MELQFLTWMMDVFFILTLHVLYKQILEERFSNKLYLMAGWIGYFVVWNVCSYLSNEYPLLNGIYTIIIHFFIMHLLYKGSLRNKIILVFVVIALGFVSEIIVGFIMQLLTSEADRKGINYLYIGSAASKIFWFIFVKMIACISKKNKQTKVAFTEWVEVFTVPIGSLIIFYAVAWKDHFDITVSKLVVVSVLLVINITTYYIYQKLQEQTNEIVSSKLLKQQNEYYKARYEDTEKQWAVLKKNRHDMKNNYALELSYLENKRYDDLYMIYTKAIGELKMQTNVINTGNIGVDAIVNYKIELARKYRIRVKQEVNVQSDILIDNGDLNILLGNLFDNAIEATAKLAEENRQITFKLRGDKTALLFVIENPYDGNVQRNDKKEIITSKADKENHGIGLPAVREIVKRYHGNMEVDADEADFKVTVFLYMQ